MSKELTALDPKREELQTVETWIAEAEAEVIEIGTALRRARGRVLDGLEAQQDQVKARLDELQERRKKLIEALGARTLTDDVIGNLTQYAEDVRLGPVLSEAEGLKHATYDEKRLTLRALQVRVKVKAGEVESVTGIIDFRSLSCAVANCSPA